MSNKKLLRLAVMGAALLSFCALAVPAHGSQPSALKVAPSSGPQGARSFTIHVAGAQFAPGARLTFNTTNITVVRTANTHNEDIDAQIDIAQGTPTTSAFDVTVTNPDGGSSTCTGCFSVTSGPTVDKACTSASEAPGATCDQSVPADTSSQDIVIHGSNLNGIAAITFGGRGVKVNSYVVQGVGNVSGQQTPAANGTLLVNIQVSSVAAPGPRSITIATTDGARGTCTPVAGNPCLNILGGKPSVTSLSPSSRGAGAIAQSIGVYGNNFANGSTVAFSNPGVHVNSISVPRMGKLVANVSIDATAAPGLGNVTVTNADGKTASCTGCFTVNPGPTIGAPYSPQAPQGARGANVTIPGGGFARGVKVYFPRATCVDATHSVASCSDDIRVERTVYTDANQPISANIDVAPYTGHLNPADSGLRAVAVVNPDGGTSICAMGNGGCFNISAGPTVAAISPNSLPRGSTQQSLTISVANANGPVTLAFTGGGITIDHITPAANGTITAIVDVSRAAVLSARNVTLSAADGGRGVCVKCFTVDWPLPIPTVATPSSAVTGARNFKIRVSGSNFPSGSVVTISDPNGAIHTTTTWMNVGTLSTVVTVDPNATVGPHNILVTNPGGHTGTCQNCFTINPPPSIEAVAPPVEPVGSSHVTINVTGAGFINGAQVSLVCDPAVMGAGCVNGVRVHRTTYQGPGLLQVELSIAPNATLGQRQVQLVQPDGSSTIWFYSFQVIAQPT